MNELLITSGLIFFYVITTVSYLIDVMLSARHATAHNAATYQQDASTKWELNVRERFSAENHVGRFKSRHLNVDVHGTAVTPSTPFQKALPDLAQWWYEKCLGLEQRPFERPMDVLALALQEKVPGSNTVDFDTVQKTISTHVQDCDILCAIMKQVKALAFTHSKRENAELLRRLEGEKLSPVGMEVTKGQKNSASGSVSSVSIPSRGSIELPTQGLISLSTTVQKLAFIQAIYQQFLDKTGGDKEALTPASKRWCNRYFRVVDCLNKHLRGNVASFIEEYNCANDFYPSKFKCTHGCK